MDKNEILEKAQNESSGKDEMEKRTKLLSMRQAELFFMGPLLIFAFIRLVRHESVNDFWAIAFGMEAFPTLFLAIKEKKISYFLIGGAMLFMTVITAYLFFKNYGMGM